jgi:hypothetical protein
MSSVDRVRARLREVGASAARGRSGGSPARERRPRGTRSGGGVDLGGVEPGTAVAAVSAVLLLLLMLGDWFLGGSAWQLKWVDLLLLGLAGLTLAAAVAHALRRDDFPRDAAGLVLTLTGGLAVGVMLTLVLESTGGTVWLVLSLVAAIGMLVGGLVTLGPALSLGGTGGPRPRRDAPRRPTERAEEPPPEPRVFDRDGPAA